MLISILVALVVLAAATVFALGGGFAITLEPPAKF
jgi:hypothetical protein